MEDCQAISISVPRWLEVIQEWYEKDAQAKELLAQLSIDPKGVGDFALVDGVIQHQGRIWLGNHQEAKQAVLLALHSSGLGGHSGVAATYQRVKQLFSWPAMKKEVHDYVQGCQVCQQAKVEHCKLPGLLQPLSVPLQAWHTISMDFIEGLPRLGGFDTIMVVIDKFTKFARFIPLTHPFTALSVAQLFMRHVYEVFGMPRIIISDRDRVFTSALWQELFRLADVKLNMSSSYNPQTDGQTERLNQCLETYLRCAVHSCPTKWSQWLSQAQYWYNTSFHSALGKTLYEVLFARKADHFGVTDLGQSTVPDVHSWLQDRAHMNDLLH